MFSEKIEVILNRGLPEQLDLSIGHKTGKIEAPIQLGGAPEFLAADGAGIPPGPSPTLLLSRRLFAPYAAVLVAGE